jgi:hypothetical protein
MARRVRQGRTEARVSERRRKRRADVEYLRVDLVPPAEEMRPNRRHRGKGFGRQSDPDPPLRLSHAPTCVSLPIHPVSRLDTQASADGHSSITMTFDLYGHMFEDVEADRADMAKIEAAVRAA